MSQSATIVLLANELVQNWRKNLTLSGRLAFIENENKKKAILDQAEEFGIRQDVMELANKIFHGRQ